MSPLKRPIEDEMDVNRPNKIHLTEELIIHQMGNMQLLDRVPAMSKNKIAVPCHEPRTDVPFNFESFQTKTLNTGFTCSSNACNILLELKHNHQHPFNAIKNSACNDATEDESNMSETTVEKSCPRIVISDEIRQLKRMPLISPSFEESIKSHHLALVPYVPYVPLWPQGLVQIDEEMDDSEPVKTNLETEKMAM